MPGGAFKVPFGDQARVSNAPMFMYDREAMLDVLPSAKLDATLASQVQAWLNLIGQVPTREVGVPSVLTDELLHFDPALPAAERLERVAERLPRPRRRGIHLPPELDGSQRDGAGLPFRVAQRES